MALPNRKAAAAAAAASGEVNFLDLGMYVQGGGFPEGDYQLVFNVMMFQAKTQQGVDRGPARLGVQLTATPLDATGEPIAGEKDREQFYSMGSKADASFAPDPETGKSLVAVPGGPAQTLNNSTNWAILLKSLYDSGLPQGIVSNDVSPLDGIKVHMANVPEPAERSTFVSKTGEAAEDRKAGTIAIVTEIKEDGRPWEQAAPAPVARLKPAAVKPAAAKPSPKAALAVVGKPAAKAKAAPVEAEVTAEDVEQAALSGAESVLAATPAGVGKLLLRTGTFKAVTASHNADMASAVISTYFDTDDNLNLLVGQLGYVVSGGKIVPAE